MLLQFPPLPPLASCRKISKHAAVSGSACTWPLIAAIFATGLSPFHKRTNGDFDDKTFQGRCRWLLSHHYSCSLHFNGKCSTSASRRSHCTRLTRRHVLMSISIDFIIIIVDFTLILIFIFSSARSFSLFGNSHCLPLSLFSASVVPLYIRSFGIHDFLFSIAFPLISRYYQELAHSNFILISPSLYVIQVFSA